MSFIKRKKTIAIVIGLIVMSIAFLGNIVNLAINIQWFKEVGYLSVYFTKLASILKLMIPVFIVCYISIWTYYKTFRSSVLRWKKSVEDKKSKEKIERKISIIINIIISFTISFSFASKYWYAILQFANATSFNTVDPLFKKDISFFIFKLPLIESLYKMVITIIVGLMIITIITYIILRVKYYIMYPSKRNKLSVLKKVKSIKNVGDRLTQFARKQLATLSSLILLLVSLGYLIKSWDLVYSQKGIVFGASYTDVHVTLRFYNIIAVVSLIAAIVTFIRDRKSVV